MQFKKLEIQEDGSWIKRTISSDHFKKTLLFGLVGAIIGYALFFFDQMGTKDFWADEALKNVLIGFGFGVYLNNSPCARGRC